MDSEQDHEGDTIVVEVPNRPGDKSQATIKEAVHLPYERSNYFPSSHEGDVTNGVEKQHHAPKKNSNSSAVKSNKDKNIVQKPIPVVDLTLDSVSDTEMLLAGGQDPDEEFPDDEVQEVFSSPTSLLWKSGKLQRLPNASQGGKPTTTRPKGNKRLRNGVQKIVPSQSNTSVNTLLKPGRHVGRYGDPNGLMPLPLLQNSLSIDNHQVHPRRRRVQVLHPRNPLHQPVQYPQVVRTSVWTPSILVQPVDPRKAIPRSHETNPYNV